ncbi:MAG: acyl-CoA dehydrogenase [Devosia sp.]|nr:acyl-CoA dehydrogenase [Devosia sp.]
MTLKLTDEQDMIQAEASRYLDDFASRAAVRATIEGPDLWDEALWTGFAQDMGMAGIAVDEAHGGLGLGMTVLCLLLEETGRRLAPMPFYTSVALTGAVLREAVSAEAQARLLPGIADGSLRATVALPALGGRDPLAGIAVCAELSGDGYRLSGAVAQVLDLPVANLVIVPALVEGRLALFALTPEDGFGVTTLAVLDETRPIGRLLLDGVNVGVAARIDGPDLQAGLYRALDRALVALAAEQMGAAQGCFDQLLAYISERVQFGRTIASFQAIKHRCAALSVEIGTVRALVAGVARLIDAGGAEDLVRLEAAAAHAAASEVLFHCAAEAIQMHGGVGFTWEYDPHFYFKRAQASAHWLGAAPAHFEAIAASLIEKGMKEEESEGDADPFRRRVAEWMAEKLGGPFEPLRFRGGAGDGDALPDLRKSWERELALGGWTGLGWPQETGGQGLSVAEQVVFYEEYARAGGPGRMGHIGEGLIGPTLVAFGTEAQKARHLPGILQGTTFWGQGYSEPSAGSDLGNIRTRARRDPATGDWLVTGQKIWTSLAHLSDWIFVLARCEDGSVGRNGLIFLLMPLHQAGVSIHPIRQINGGAEFNSVFFDEARASADDVIGAPGEGWKIAMALLGFERGISTLGQQMGFTQELEAILDLVRRNGAAAAAGIGQRLGRAWMGLRAMRYGALRSLAGGASNREVLGYKYEWSNWHRALGELGMDVLGAEGNVVSGDAETNRLQQLFLFSRSETIYGGTNEIQLNIIAEQGLGMPREPRGTLG